MSTEKIYLSNYTVVVAYGLGDNSVTYNTSYSYNSYFILSSSSILPYGMTSGIYAFKVPRRIIDENREEGEFIEESNFYFKFYLNQINHTEELVLKL